MNKLDRVMLIDDNEFDNEFHRREILKTGLVAEVTSFDGAEQAIEHLRDRASCPASTDAAATSTDGLEMIFLDVNMPAMNGWEFLQAYEQLPEACRSHSLVMMLSTTLHDEDRRRAEAHPLVTTVVEKPLTAAILRTLLDEL